MREPQLPEPIPQIPRAGEIRDSNRRKAERIEIGDERAIGAHHQLGVQPDQPCPGRAHARLGEEAPIPCAILYATEEIDVDVSSESGASDVVHRRGGAEPSLPKRDAEGRVCRGSRALTGRRERGLRNVDVVDAP